MLGLSEVSVKIVSGILGLLVLCVCVLPLTSIARVQSTIASPYQRLLLLGGCQCVSSMYSLCLGMNVCMNVSIPCTLSSSPF